MTLRLTIFLILFSVFQLNAQSNTIAQDTTTNRYTDLSISYSLGGIWYLNILDYLPKLSLTVSHGWKAKNHLIGLRIGYEHLADDYFIPVGLNFTKITTKTEFGLFLGYAFAGNYLEVESKEFDIKGGVATDLFFGYNLYNNAEIDIIVFTGYQLRHTVLQFNYTGGSGEIESNQYFHHLNLGSTIRF